MGLRIPGLGLGCPLHLHQASRLVPLGATSPGRAGVSAREWPRRQRLGPQEGSGSLRQIEPSFARMASLADRILGGLLRGSDASDLVEAVFLLALLPPPLPP